MVRMKLLKSTMEESTQVGGRETMRSVTVDSALGMLSRRPLPPIWIPACDGEVRYFGSFENIRRWQAGPLFRYLLDNDPAVRQEVAYAIGTFMAIENLESDLVTAAVKELHACWLRQDDPEVQGVLLETIGIIRYANDDQRRDAEAFLVKESGDHNPDVKVLGAVSGLEAMIRRTTQ